MSNIARSLKAREQAFEAHYQLDEEQNFKIRARRNRLFGDWIANKLCLFDKNADDYAVKLAMLDLDEAGDDNILKKIRKDLKDADIKIDDMIIVERLGLCQIQAMEELRREYPHSLGQGFLN